MANVDQNVELIRKAIYGKEVREALASGIESINAETESTTARQSKLEADMQVVKDETIQATANAITATESATNAATSASNAATSAVSAAESANTAATNANNFVQASEVCEPYDNTKTYNKYNKVTHLGSTYQCLVDGTVGITPGSDSIKWLLIAAKGTDGIGGDMFKSTYDTDSDGVVDSAEAITNGSITYFASDLKNNFDTIASSLSDKATKDGTLQTNLNSEKLNGKTATVTPLTTEKNDIVGMVNELFTNANNLKSDWAGVVGSPLLATDTSAQLKSKTQTLKNTMATNLTNKGQISAGTESLNNLINKIPNISTKAKYFVDSPSITVLANQNYNYTINSLNFKPIQVFIIGTLYINNNGAVTGTHMVVGSGEIYSGSDSDLNYTNAYANQFLAKLRVINPVFNNTGATLTLQYLPQLYTETPNSCTISKLIFIG